MKSEKYWFFCFLSLILTLIICLWKSYCMKLKNNTYIVLPQNLDQADIWDRVINNHDYITLYTCYTFIWYASRGIICVPWTYSPFIFYWCNMVNVKGVSQCMNITWIKIFFLVLQVFFSKSVFYIFSQFMRYLF